MKNPRIIFWFIIVLTIFAVFIDLPKVIDISFDSPTLPVINKKISIHKKILGFNPGLFLSGEREFDFRKGLDLEGGVSITLKADMKGIATQQRNSALESAKTVIERRINFFGVSEPVIQKATVNGDYRIIVELPGVTDVNQAIKLVGTTAQLSFWEDTASSSAKAQPIATSSALPYGITNIFQNPQKTDLTGSDLQETAISFDQNTGKPQVKLVFTGDGTKKFAEITKRNVGKIVAIALDNQIIEAPRVNEPIINGSAVITGSFTTETAKALSIQLNAGALPVPLTILEQHAVGATLGTSSLQKSLFAGILGFFVIVLFMVVLYGSLGLLASIALLLYTIFVLAIFKLSSLTPFGITLTLAGIAGFILSIGMAVDANILIFERMKEELRLGRKKDAAIELGFTRAWSSIRDSNVSSLITSGILYKFGTGQVRGFAVTLAIGVLISMFSAILVTRTFLRLIYRK
ncbi:protein translocase subunit SecD [Candidatus Microgenomates bacterium]|nr:MAG: protein translocase subunit SecD [Candidatus Microgenomates bacterium]